LDLLGFIRPNQDFSKGYGQKNKKNRLASQVVCKTSQARSTSLLAPRRKGARVASGEYEDPIPSFGICQTNAARLALGIVGFGTPASLPPLAKRWRATGQGGDPGLSTAQNSSWIAPSDTESNGRSAGEIFLSCPLASL
jgi:hypothetical protein